MSDDRGSARKRDELSSAKRALLEARLRGDKTLAEQDRDRIARGDPNVPAPMSYQQRRLWFLEQLEPGSLAHVLPSALRISGKVDGDALQKAFSEIVRRHESLRTVFVDEGKDEPVLAFAPQDTVRLQVEDLREVAESDRLEQAQRWLANEARRPFDLEKGPLFRAAWIRLSEDDHIFATIAHHAVWDGWSAGVFINELQTLYRRYREGQASEFDDLPIQYGDYTRWQRQKFATERSNAALMQRVERLTGAPARLELPTDRPRPAVQTVNGSMFSFKLEGQLTKRLNDLSLKEGTTLFMTLLAGFTVLLSRYSRQTDVVVGTPVAGRELKETEGLIGFFANTLCLRTELTGDPTFTELMARVRDESLAAFADTELPFEQLVEALQPVRDRSYSPLFQVLFALQNLPPQTLDLAGAEMAMMSPGQRASPFDLTLYLWEEADRLQGAFEYNTDLFDESTIARMFGHYETLLSSAVADPGASVSTLEMLTGQEREQLIRGWNATAASYPEDDNLIHLFERQVEQTPQADAVRFESNSLTYSELNERANQLGRHLQHLGVGPDDRVALAMERSCEVILAIYGILKSGGAYAPMDPALPTDRLAFMLGDMGAKVLITETSVLDRLPESDAHVICLDRDWDTIAAEDTSAPVCAAGPEDLAYVIYTSGSTGLPKGVQIPRRAVVNLVTALREKPGLGPDDTLLAVAALSFDMSVVDVFLPICVGACLTLVSRATATDGEALAAALSESGATAMQATPTTWRLLIESGWRGTRGLKVLCGGEAWNRDLADEILERCDSLWNMYGPTETTVWSAAELIERGDGPVLIGPPIANTQLYVLDSALNLLPIGVPGELCIGGDGLARGYHNRDELTADRFVADPFSDVEGARIYRTGDLACRKVDGRIEFYGRLDHQVKFRGYRIELGEIEAVLTALPAVNAAVVLAREDVPGDPRLVAYVVPDSGQTIDFTQLRKSAQSKLPDYMVPTAWVTLESLPLTPNRKIDRNALPAPDISRRETEAEFVAPRNDDEQALSDIWTEVLRLDRVGVHDDFFALGGHSLLATQVIARIRATLRIELPLRVLFEAPTIAALAEHTAQLRAGAVDRSGLPLVRERHDGPMPLSFAQQRLWFFDQLEPGSTTYNMFGALRLRGNLNVEALHSSLNDILRRHEVLRTAIRSTGGEPTQVVVPATELDFPIVDLAGLSAQGREAEISAEIDAESKRSFDLDTPPLFRSRLLRLGDEEHVLLLSLHHIAADGWSQTVLINELARSYAAHLSGESADLPELPIQYSDYARWQREWLQGEVLEKQLGYWRSQLGDNLPTLALPEDYPRPSVQTFEGAHETRRLDDDLASALHLFNREHGVTTFMTLFAAFSIVLARWSGQDDIVVGTPVAGRSRRETEDLIGFFVNTLVLRMKLSGSPRFIDVVRQAKQLTLDGHAHQDLPFERLVEALQPDRDLSRTPLFQVMINMLNAGRDPIRMPDLTVDFLANSDLESKFDVTLYVADSADAVELSLVYNADLYSAPRMAEMADQLEKVIGRIVESPEQAHAAAVIVTDTSQRVLPDPSAPLNKRWLGSIPERLTAMAGNVPDRTAVIDPLATWTYAELEARSNRLAHYLLGAGLEPNDVVAIYGHRSAALVWAVMGVLKAGGAFLILDPAYPAPYLVERVVQSRPRAWLQVETAGAVADVLMNAVASAGVDACLTLPADGLPDPLVACSTETPPVDIEPDQLAYLAFTSGSTGGPKGIIGTHRPLSHFLDWYEKRFELDHSDRISMLSGLSHDPLLRDILTPPWIGGTLCIPAPQQILAPTELRRWMDELKITVVHLTPALAQVLMGSVRGRQEPLSALRLIVFGGETLPRAAVSQMREQAPNAIIVNAYGTTETPQIMACHVVGESDGDASPYVPIGRAIEGAQLLVIARGGRMASIGELGDIVVRTPYLTEGYLDDAVLTASRYAQNPFGDVATDRVYRTGDRGRYLPDGSVAFAGRGDAQVKIRGFRVELGGVEEALLRHAGVSACAVVDYRQSGGDPRLVAYVVAAGDDSPDAGELRAFMSSQLPDYMVPTLYQTLTELPLTPNGKLDRKRLPNPSRIVGTAVRVRPRTPIEVQLCTIWERILAEPGLEVGVTDNFFELGGHSLQAVRMFSQINDVFGRDLPLETLFLAPTVEKLAGVLGEGGWNSPWKALVAINPGGSKEPLFLVPGLGGNVLTFVHLANLLGPEQPLYGFQSRGLNGHEKPFTQVERIAEYYLNELRQFKPHGPYLLGGACMGGTVAFEMAQRLVAAGEKVDLLVFIEPSRLLAVGPRARLRRWALSSTALTKFFSMFRPLGYLLQRAAVHLGALSKLHIREWVSYIRDRSGTVKEMIQQQDVFRGDSDFVNQEKVLNANFGAMRSYQPKVYPGDIRIILASDRPVLTQHDARLKWTRYAGNGHRVDHVSVKDSGDMFIEPFVHELAEKLNAILGET